MVYDSHTETLFIEIRDHALSKRVPLLSRQARPLQRLVVILLHTCSQKVLPRHQHLLHWVAYRCRGGGFVNCRRIRLCRLIQLRLCNLGVEPRELFAL